MQRRLLSLVLLGVLLWASPAQAAILFLEAGTSATFGKEFWTNTAFSSSTFVTHTGPRVIKVASTNTANKVLANAGNTGRFTMYWQTPDSPTGIGRFVNINIPSGPTRFGLYLKTGRVLQLGDGSNGGVLGSACSTLSASTWYRISVSWNITSSTVYTIKSYVNGALDCTITNAGTLDSGGTNNQLAIGDGDGIGFDSYFDDVYVDDDSSNTDTGNIRVTAKLPASVNTGGFGTTVGTGAVNERPLSETNGMEDTSINGDQQNYTLQAAAVGDVNLTGATIVARSAWIWAKVDVASVLAKIMDNGSESAITLTTSPALYTLLTASASYPSNAAGIGIRSSTTANTFLYECGTLIAYIPAAAASAVRHRAISQ